MAATHLPALKFHFLTPLYDWFIHLTMPEMKIKQRLIEQAGLKASDQVLDFGCGTATLLLLLEEVCPDCHITGLEIDRRMASIATKKLQQRKSACRLVKYDGGSLPFPDRTFDKVLSSWVFSQMTPAQKSKAFCEINRILKPQGELHIADWGKAENGFMRFLFFLIQLLDNFYTTNDNIKGRLPQLIEKCGFSQANTVGNQSTLFGTLSFFKAVKT
ncbi:MAG: class I SAM-dependent methyltransferase [Spirosomataceae bacterium]